MFFPRKILKTKKSIILSIISFRKLSTLIRWISDQTIAVTSKTRRFFLLNSSRKISIAKDYYMYTFIIQSQL